MENKEIGVWEFMDMLDSASMADGEYFMIKANLPNSIYEYIRGIGAEAQILVDREIKASMEANKSSKPFLAYLYGPCPESVYTSRLADDVLDFKKENVKPLEFEYRGECRPVLAMKKLRKFLSGRDFASFTTYKELGGELDKNTFNNVIEASYTENTLEGPFGK